MKLFCFGRKNKTTFLILAIPAPMNTSHKTVKNQVRTSARTQVPSLTTELHCYVPIILSTVSRNSQHPKNPEVWQFECLGKHELKSPNSDKTISCTYLVFMLQVLRCWKNGRQHLFSGCTLQEGAVRHLHVKSQSPKQQVKDAFLQSRRHLSPGQGKV